MEQDDASYSSGADADYYERRKTTPGRPGSKLGGLVILVGLPFTVFLLIFTTYVFAYSAPGLSGFITIFAVGCALFCMIMDRKNRRKWWFYVGALSFVAAFFALLFGVFMYQH